jgi:uncharacterized protein YjdB
MLVGDTVLLTAAFELESGRLLSASEVSWRSRHATVLSVDQQGRARGVGGGVGIVEAEALGLTGEAVITVAEREAPVGLEVVPSAPKLAVGDTVRFHAVLVMESGERDEAIDVSWRSLRPNVVQIDATGLATAVSEGTARVIAECEGLSVEVLVTSLKVVDPVALIIQPDSSAVFLGQNRRLGAWFVTESDDTVLASGVTWTALTPSVATVDVTGLVTGIDEGSAGVGASASGFQAEAAIFVIEAAGLHIVPGTIQVEVGETSQVSALFETSSGDSLPAPGTVWRSLAPSVVSVSSDGVVLGREPGWGSIEARNLGLADTADVIVSTPVGLVVRPDTGVVLVGGTKTFTAWIVVATGDTILTPGATWNSLSPSLATVDENGLVTGQAEGVATIRAATLGFETEATVYVLESLIFTIVPDTVVISSGGAGQLSAVFVFSTGDSLPITDGTEWNSLDPSVVEVDADGVVTGLSSGWGEVEARNSGAIDTAAVGVSPPTDLLITPDSVFTAVGHNAQLTAWFVTNEGDTVAATSTTWTSLSPSIATVDEDGAVLGVAEGIATIQAAAQGLEAEATAHVVQPTAIAIVPDTMRLEVGSSAQATAVFVLPSGDSLPAGDGVSWTSLQPGVADFTADDWIAAFDCGYGAIVASYAGMVDTAAVITDWPGPWFCVPPLPQALYGGHAAVIDGKIYHAGGAIAEEAFVFDPVSSRWSEIAPMAWPRWRGAVGVLDGKLHVIAGPGTVAGSWPNDAYDPVTDSWEVRAPTTIQPDYSSADTLLGRVYVVGGLRTLNAVRSYDPVTNTWYTEPELHPGRYNAVVGSINGQLYVAAGHAVYGGGFTAVVDAYDPSSRSWYQVSQMPVGPGQASGCVCNGKLVVLPYKEERAFAYDPATDSWSVLPSQPYTMSREYTQAVCINGVVYVLGGWQNRTKVLANVDALVIP